MEMGEIHSFHHFMQKGLLFLDNSPSLLSKKSSVESAQFFEIEPTLKLWAAVFAPPYLMHFPLFLLLAHQKLAIRRLILSQRTLGSLKTLMAKVGITNATALRSTSFPPCDNTLPFQEWRHCQSLDLISEKDVLLDLPIIGERPKSFSYWLVLLVPDKPKISSLT